MGFSEQDLPDFDVVAGQVTKVEPTTEERELTSAEKEDIELLREAFALRHVAWDELPELAQTEEPELAGTR